MNSSTYAEAGVDVKKAESFVERLKKMSRRAGHEELWKGAGGYAAVYPTGKDQAVAVTTDGVGTKLLLANKLQRYDTIGIDLVAMCANDLICVGAKPTIFLDYFAIGVLEDKAADQIIKGIVDGCDQAQMILAGGETAEMPGLYQPGHFDLAGFALGHVTRSSLITGSGIAAGQTVIGVASSGIHSNGLSLARKVLPDTKECLESLLVPTHIYVQPVVQILNAIGSKIKGIAHITGGGWRNLFRLNESVGFAIENPLPIPSILQQIGKSVTAEEMYKTFNMGMGLTVIVNGTADYVIKVFQDAGFHAQVIGEVTDEPKKMRIGKIDGVKSITLVDS